MQRDTVQKSVFLIKSTVVSLNSTVSLPRLVDMDWRVDIKTSSDTISRMAVPTCLLQLKVLFFHYFPVSERTRQAGIFCRQRLDTDNSFAEVFEALPYSMDAHASATYSC